MDTIQSALAGIQAIPNEAWVLIAGAIGFSAIQQKVKHWLQIENPKVLVFITGLFSMAGAVIPAVLGWLSANPANMTATTALWFTGMTLAYRYVVEPSSRALNSWKSDLAAYKEYKTSIVAAETAPEPVEIPEESITAVLESSEKAQDPKTTATIEQEFQG